MSSRASNLFLAFLSRSSRVPLALLAYRPITLLPIFQPSCSPLFLSDPHKQSIDPIRLRLVSLSSLPPRPPIDLPRYSSVPISFFLPSIFSTYLTSPYVFINRAPVFLPSPLQLSTYQLPAFLLSIYSRFFSLLFDRCLVNFHISLVSLLLNFPFSFSFSFLFFP